MKSKRILKQTGIIALLSIMLLGQSLYAYAWKAPVRKPHPVKQTKVIARIPRGRPFRWQRDGFYRRSKSGISIDFHLGRVVLSLPLGYRKIVVRNRPYFYCDGIYYERLSRGYVVVAPPYVCCQASECCDSDMVTINIPNANGSYTPVVLEKSGSGYIGPQGEYYPEHPTVDQLVALYGR